VHHSIQEKRLPLTLEQDLEDGKKQVHRSAQDWIQVVYLGFQLLIRGTSTHVPGF